ncbi:MAG: peroxiredoxin-like family protein [Acidobacteriota bacterium]|nr:peroxiredoxin-like family protein [Acidobacteriota bacterium]
MKTAALSLLLITTGVAFAADSPARTATGVRPLLIGSQVPDVSLTKPDGTALDLRKAVSEKPTLLIFYRGSWCPYCQKHLGQLQEKLGDYAAGGYQVFAIAQDTPEVNAGVMKKQGLDFPVLSDKGLNAASQFGLVFEMDMETVKRYKNFGIDLIGLYGRKEPRMTVPAIFLIGTDGRIRFNYVNPDYRIRLDSDVLLAAMNAYK